MYNITDYTYKKAKALNVQVKASSKKNKKIDVIKNGKIIASVGDKRFKDYPTYIEEKGKAYADKRRSLYKLRHKKDINVMNSNGFYANKLLW
jgi:hypothetical protein